MGAVGSGLALRLDHLLQRFPMLLELAVGRPRRGDEDSPTALATVIEREIIPRLLLEHPPGAAALASPDEGSLARVTAADIEALAKTAIEADAVALLDRAERLLASGVPVETLLLEGIAPVGRLLGDWWTADRCSFTAVTMGLWRLEEVVRHLAPRVPQRRPADGVARRALLATLPGDQHRLGLQLLGLFFGSAGWTVELSEESGHLTRVLAAASFDLVGISVNQDHQVETLPGLIARLRAASRNPELLVMVGGALFCEHPELADLVGADATAKDAASAVRLAEARLSNPFARATRPARSGSGPPAATEARGS